MAKINARSPFFVYYTDTNLTQADLELYIYTGTQTTSRPGTPTYTLTKYTSNDEVLFEIAELVRDYIEITFNGAYDSQMVWVDYQMTPWISSVEQSALSFVQYTGFDGFGYPEDGAQNQSLEINTGYKMFSGNLVYKMDDNTLRIPVEAAGSYDVTFHYNGELMFTQAITAATTSSTRIKYLEDATGLDSYKDRVIADGGTYEESYELTVFLNSLDIFPVDTIYIDGEPIIVKTFEECKYTPVKFTYVNKFGAFSDLWLQKRLIKKLNTNETTYKQNIVSSTGTFASSDHVQKSMVKNGNLTLTVTSGFIHEDYNYAFEELMLSEQVWVRLDDGNVYPVTLKTKDFTFKTSVNDKLIEYTFDFEIAYNRINNFR